MAVNKVIYGGNTLVDLTGDTVTAADLADGVKATGADGNPIVGIMQKVTISSTEQAKIIATNIRAGVSILGVEGTMSGTEGAKAQAKTATPKTTAQTILPDSAQGFNYLTQVTVNAIPYNESDNAQGGKTVTIG